MYHILRSHCEKTQMAEAEESSDEMSDMSVDGLAELPHYELPIAHPGDQLSVEFEVVVEGDPRFLVDLEIQSFSALRSLLFPEGGPQSYAGPIHLSVVFYHFCSIDDTNANLWTTVIKVLHWLRRRHIVISTDQVTVINASKVFVNTAAAVRTCIHVSRA